MKCPACKGRFTSFDRQRGLSVHVVCNTNDPNTCNTCGEPLSRVTKSSIKCRCLEPYIPGPCVAGCKMKHIHDFKPKNQNLSPQVRYGN